MCAAFHTWFNYLIIQQLELKTFSESVLYKFHEALGQFLDDKDLMEERGIDRILYIAIGEDTFNKMNDIEFLLKQINRYSMKLIIVDIEAQKIVR
jgi:hypothetical protein